MICGDVWRQRRPSRLGSKSLSAKVWRKRDYLCVPHLCCDSDFFCLSVFSGCSEVGALMPLGYSAGLSVSGFYGTFNPGPNPAHVSLAALDWRTALAVQFAHSGPLDEQRGVVIQVGRRLNLGCNYMTILLFV